MHETKNSIAVHLKEFGVGIPVADGLHPLDPQRAQITRRTPNPESHRHAGKLRLLDCNGSLLLRFESKPAPSGSHAVQVFHHPLNMVDGPVEVWQLRPRQLPKPDRDLEKNCAPKRRTAVSHFSRLWKRLDRREVASRWLDAV